MELAYRILHKIYRHYFGIEAIGAMPLNMCIGLTKTVPLPTGTNVTEPTLAEGYGDRPTVYGPASWLPITTDGEMVDNVDLEWGPFTVEVTVQGYVFYENASGTQVSRYFGYKPFPGGPITVPANKKLVREAGGLKLVPAS